MIPECLSGVKIQGYVVWAKGLLPYSTEEQCQQLIAEIDILEQALREKSVQYTANE